MKDICTHPDSPRLRSDGALYCQDCGTVVVPAKRTLVDKVVDDLADPSQSIMLGCSSSPWNVKNGHYTFADFQRYFNEFTERAAKRHAADINEVQRITAKRIRHLNPEFIAQLPIRCACGAEAMGGDHLFRCVNNYYYGQCGGPRPGQYIGD